MTQIAVQVGAAGSINSQNDVRVVVGLEPQAVAAPVNGAGVDLRGYEGASLTMNVAAVTDGEYAVTIEHSDDDGAGDAYAAVTALDAAFTQYSSTLDQLVEIRRVGNDITGTPTPLKRWVRLVIAEPVAGVTGGIMSGVWVLGKKRSSIGDNVA